MFDECGNEVEGNKEVIELAVYIALGRTLLVKCRDSLGTWNLRQLKLSWPIFAQRPVYPHVRHISGF